MTKMALLVRIAHFRKRVRRMDTIPEKYMRAAEAGYGWVFNKGKGEGYGNATIQGRNLGNARDRKLAVHLRDRRNDDDRM